MDSAENASVSSSLIDRSVWTFFSPVAIHVSTVPGSFSNCVWSSPSAAVSSVPWFSDRLRSPFGVSWRFRENARACLPLSVCTPARKLAPE